MKRPAKVALPLAAGERRVLRGSELISAPDYALDLAERPDAEIPAAYRYAPGRWQSVVYRTADLTIEPLRADPSSRSDLAIFIAEGILRARRELAR